MLFWFLVEQYFFDMKGMEKTKMKNRTIPQIWDGPKTWNVPRVLRYSLNKEVILFLSNYLVDTTIHLDIHLAVFLINILLLISSLNKT